MINMTSQKREKIDALYPEANMIEIEKIGSLPKNKAGKTIDTVGNSGLYFAQAKKDGYSYTFEKTENHEYLFSRNISTVTGLLSEKSKNVPHIIDALKHLPAGTILVGEIYYPNKTSKDVTSVMGALPEKALANQKAQGNISYYIHDIVAYDGTLLDKIDAWSRYQKLEEVFNKYGLATDNVELAEAIRDADLAQFAEELIASGEEGAVLKLIKGKYAFGKRPAWQTIKVKKSDTVDVICIGFEAATKVYDGTEEAKYWVMEKNTSPDSSNPTWTEVKRWMGAHEANRSPLFRTIGVTKPYYYNWYTSLVLGLKGEDGSMVKVGTVSSGLNDGLRESISKNPESYLNKVVECGVMELGDRSLRHPIFVRFRDDKNSDECTISEVFK